MTLTCDLVKQSAANTTAGSDVTMLKLPQSYCRKDWGRDSDVTAATVSPVSALH